MSKAWPSTEAEALAVQDELRAQVEQAAEGDVTPATVAGLDVAYHEDGERLAAAAVVLDARTHEVVDLAVTVGRAAFPYVPGLFAFREVPALLEALGRLRVEPDVLVCDGHGVAHPRRFGLACHLGVVTGRPAFGVGKTPLVGAWAEPGPARGDSAALVDAGEEVGRVVRTRDGVKPVFVSVGHRIHLGDAVKITLGLARAFRLPESTRAADQVCRAALRGATVGGQIGSDPPADRGSATLGPSTAHRGKGAGVV